MSNSKPQSRTQKAASRDLLLSMELAMAHEPTRVFVRWILEQSGMYETSFTGNSETFYKEGRRSMGLEIVAALNEIDPLEIVRLMKDGADDIVKLRNKDRKEAKDDA